MSPLRRAVFRVRGAYHLAAAVWSGSAWTAAGTPDDSRAVERSGAQDEPVVGLVEQFGRDRVVGWVSVRPGHRPVVITLHVGPVAVTRTVARPDERAPRRLAWHEVRHFELQVSDVWQFVRPAARLSVRIDGEPLPIAGRGMFRRGGRDAAAEPRDLAAAMQAGGSFDEDGRFRPGPS